MKGCLGRAHVALSVVSVVAIPAGHGRPRHPHLTPANMLYAKDFAPSPPIITLKFSKKIPRLFYRFLFFVKSRNLQNDLGFRLTWNLFRLTWNMSAKMFHSTILDKIGCVLIKRFWVKTYSRINLKHARRAGCDLPKNRFKQIRHGSNLNDQDVQPLWEGFSEGRRCSRDTYPESLITGYILINEDHPRQPCPA